MQGIERAIWGNRRPPKKKVLPSGTRFATANANVRITCAAKGTKHAATMDPNDRAHLDFDSAGMLLPAARGRDGEKPRGKAREYPKSQMTANGVSIDSVFDATHARKMRLNRLLNGDGNES